MFKKVVYGTLGLLLAITFLVALVPDLVTQTATIADNTSMPSMVQTTYGIAEWAVPTLLVVGIILAAVGILSARKMRSSRRRR